MTVAIQELVCCPPCGKEGKRSRVYPRSVQIDTTPVEPYFDEAGLYHGHGGWRTTLYQCSNGHWWTVTRRDKCRHCSYGGERRFDEHVHAMNAHAIHVLEGAYSTACVCGAIGRATGSRGVDLKTLVWSWQAPPLPATSGGAS